MTEPRRRRSRIRKHVETPPSATPVPIAHDPHRDSAQAKVDGFLHTLKNGGPHAVRVEIADEHRVLADAIGLEVFGLPIGRVRINRRLFGILTEPELDFVIAHETVHIQRSHYVATASMAIVRGMFDAEAKRDPELRSLVALWDVGKAVGYLAGTLPPAAEITKRQELEADAWAAWLTGNPQAAHSALAKLVNNDLSAPSHTWELRGTNLPIMTMNERLLALWNSVYGRRSP